MNIIICHAIDSITIVKIYYLFIYLFITHLLYKLKKK